MQKRNVSRTRPWLNQIQILKNSDVRIYMFQLESWYLSLGNNCCNCFSRQHPHLPRLRRLPQFNLHAGRLLLPFPESLTGPASHPPLGHSLFFSRRRCRSVFENTESTSKWGRPLHRRPIRTDVSSGHPSCVSFTLQDRLQIWSWLMFTGRRSAFGCERGRRCWRFCDSGGPWTARKSGLGCLSGADEEMFGVSSSI